MDVLAQENEQIQDNSPEEDISLTEYDYLHHDESDVCRVCRMEATPNNPLHYPCICTGSIKFIHQDCLMQWLDHSKKEYCELCAHKFTFKAVYSPDMPKSIPVLEILHGFWKNIIKALQYWLHYTLVIILWLGVVPLIAYRIYKCLFSGSVKSLLTLPYDMLTLESIFMDCVFGALVVSVSIGGFIMLLWLREQVVVHGVPNWLNDQDPEVQGFRFIAIFRNLFGNRPEQPQEPPQENLVADDEDHAGVANNIGDNVPDVAEHNAENNHDNDGGWNPDAIMEDLTWERFLGLDGSFVFLEHVFWIISLNTSFILVFAFCPYHIGLLFMTVLFGSKKLSGNALDGAVMLLIGYFVITISMVLLHYLLGFTSFRRLRKTIAKCYIVLKVAILIVVEIGFFPLVCGWWLDICSLPLFAISLQDRKDSLEYAPVTATFLHWLVGMLYVFYFASFIILLREILRPGVLWFLRNINDPQFHPVKEMIQLSVFRHARRFALSLIVFGSTVLVVVWIPVQLIKLFSSGFIPFNVSLNIDAPISEMSLELLLLQVVLPAFLEQGHARKWLKDFIQLWTRVVSKVLDMRSYIIGDVDLKTVNAYQIVYVDAMGRWQKGPLPKGLPLENALEGVGSPIVRSYHRSQYFKIRVCMFIIIVMVSFIMAAVMAFTLPVIIGRNLLALVFGDTVVHELYTAAVGFYVIWLTLRILVAVSSWYPVGFSTVYRKAKWLLSIVSKVILGTLALFGITPFLLGIIFELVVVIPLRVPYDQTPVIYIWQDWALGVLHLKIMCALIMVGPNWWLQNAIDRAYRNGFANIDLTFIMTKIFYPVINTLMLAITIPYVVTAGVLPWLGVSEDNSLLCLRRVYPVMMCIILLAAIVIFQGKQFKALYERIRNEKYLIGKILINYDPQNDNTENVK